MSTLSHNFWLGDHPCNRPVLGEFLTYLYILNYTVVLCLSFTFLWYGIVWYSYTMIWYFYAMLWDIKKWYDMVCLAADLWLPGLKMSGYGTGELQRIVSKIHNIVRCDNRGVILQLLKFQNIIFVKSKSSWFQCLSVPSLQGMHHYAVSYLRGWNLFQFGYITLARK